MYSVKHSYLYSWRTQQSQLSSCVALESDNKVQPISSLSNAAHFWHAIRLLLVNNHALVYFAKIHSKYTQYPVLVNSYHILPHWV